MFRKEEEEEAATDEAEEVGAGDSRAESGDGDGDSQDTDCLKQAWPSIEKIVFGPYREAKSKVGDYKLLKKIAVVGFWPELYRCWVIAPVESQHGSPACVHCRSVSLRASCRHAVRALAKKTPELFGPIWERERKGRPRESAKRRRIELAGNCLGRGVSRAVDGP